MLTDVQFFLPKIMQAFVDVTSQLWLSLNLKRITARGKYTTLLRYDKQIHMGIVRTVRSEVSEKS